MNLPPLVREYLSEFNINREKLEEIRDAMYNEFKLGLEVGSPPSSVAMIPSFVPSLPDGNGKCISRLALFIFDDRKAACIRNSFK